ncbi:MAG: ABC transporter permease [Betaproteobacteria bacterium]|nr:ABC transporter permease [Betaproteobacteria bacterium]
MAPGDPIQALIGDFPAPPEYVARVREQFGLDLPWWQQLLSYVQNVVQGDLGYSFANRRPVQELLWERLGNTLILTVSALVFATCAGIALGIAAARRPRTWIDKLVTFTSLLGFSIPVFWLGQVLILFFAVKLDWLPAQGMISSRENYEGLAYAADVASHLLLPALALSLRYLVSTARLTRTSMLEALGSDYIVTARAKGVRAMRLLYVHALPNALLPVVTSVGYNFGYVLAGSALIETVFSWPGLGRLLYDAMLARDTPVILGIFLVGAGTAVIANLITDLAYGWLDPRIRQRKP